jgi:hypothetical protein
LTARNQKTNDLLINLFKAYGSVSDEVFRAWLVRKQDNHDEGNELTPDKLMMAAKNKYDVMVEKGTWNAPTAEEKIVALEAKFNSVANNLTKKLAAKGESKGAKSAKKQKDEGKGDHPKHWKLPKSANKKEVPYKGHTWYWCEKDTGGKCEKWRANKPKECQWKENAPGTEDKKRKGSPTGKKTEKKLKVARAYVAKLEQKRATEESKNSDDSGSE